MEAHPFSLVRNLGRYDQASSPFIQQIGLAGQPGKNKIDWMGSPVDQILSILEEEGQIPDTIRRSFKEQAKEVKIPSGTQVAFENEACARLPFVISGTLRVFKTASDGRSITLYDIEPGESCVLTMSCILSGEPFPATAESIGETILLIIPSDAWARWVDSSPALRRYSHKIAARRLSSVIATLSEVAFHRVNQRIARLLLKRTENGDLQATHQQIADELGTAREVVSRILKDFEREGWIVLSRNTVSLKEKDALVRLADTEEGL